MAKLTDVQKKVLDSIGLSKSLCGRRVLVTGATGFLGRHLCEALSDLGANVFALSRSANSKLLAPKVKALPADLRNQKAVRDIVASARPEIVYHLAGLVDASQDLRLVGPTFQHNLAGSINLFIALAQRGCERVIVAGSSEEPDVSKYGSSPNSPYAAAKDASTAYARMFHKVFSLPVIVTRPFMSYGPHQSTRKVIPYTITNLLKEKTPKISSGKRICDMIYVQDLTMGLVLTGAKPGLVGEVIDLGTGVGTTIYNAVQMIANMIESSHKPLFGAIPDRLYEYPQIADIERTANLLGFRPQWSLREGMTETIKWYRAHPENYGMEKT
ncbi:MAG: NAD(P)-dependent oxidoreductase [Anaerolineales bacterium]